VDARDIAALSLDAMGTLLHPREPVAEVYARHAAAHGTAIDPAIVAARLRPALVRHRPVRAGDPRWRAYWAAVVAETTGCDTAELLDDLLEHFAHAPAWVVAPGAREACERVRAADLRVVVVSNFDVRLRTLVGELGIDRWIDAVVISAEEGVEKPDPELLRRAAARVGVAPVRLLHVGDEDDDVAAARAAGCAAWRWGVDVDSFERIAQRLLGPACPA
jgi:putative hydrolase of the HAD superfamily